MGYHSASMLRLDGTAIDNLPKGECVMSISLDTAYRAISCIYLPALAVTRAGTKTLQMSA